MDVERLERALREAVIDRGHAEAAVLVSRARLRDATIAHADAVGRKVHAAVEVMRLEKLLEGLRRASRKVG